MMNLICHFKVIIAVAIIFSAFWAWMIYELKRAPIIKGYVDEKDGLE